MKTPEIPADYDLEPRGLEDALTIAHVTVPQSVIDFCADKYRETDPGIVVAEFYQGEEFLIYIEDQASAEDRAALEREGWPPRLLDCFYSLLSTPDSPTYFRLAP